MSGAKTWESSALIPAARFEISVDGVVRTHRDDREIALEAADVLKACHPYCKVVVRDLWTGQEIDPQKG